MKRKKNIVPALRGPMSNTGHRHESARMKVIQQPEWESREAASSAWEKKAEHL